MVMQGISKHTYRSHDVFAQAEVQGLVYGVVKLYSFAIFKTFDCQIGRHGVNAMSK